MTKPAKPQSYQFGDSRPAADRLRLLAEAFAPTSSEFLRSLGRFDPRAVADLGCGPGYTTRMLGEIFAAARVTGFDSSPQFIEMAERQKFPGASFVLADVTSPLPGEPFDLIYCRYLLTHLAGAIDVIESWSHRLRAGGILAIEENDWIQTTEPAMAKYLSIVERMLADSGQRLYVGAELHAKPDWHNFSVESSELVATGLSNHQAARMFVLNLESWRYRPFVERNYSSSELDRLHQDLTRLADDRSGDNAITFGRRRMVLRRKAR